MASLVDSLVHSSLTMASSFSSLEEVAEEDSTCKRDVYLFRV